MVLNLPQTDRLFPAAISATLLFFMAAAWVNPGAAAQDVSEYESQVVVVQFEPGVLIQNKSSAVELVAFNRVASALGVHTIDRVYPFLDHVQPTPKTRRNLLALRRTYNVRYNADAAPESVADSLAAAPGVVYAEPVVINRLLVSGEPKLVDPNDPLFNQQVYLQHLLLPEAWDVVKSESRTPRIVIAIVDGGGDWRHEDLRANVWTNPNEIAGNEIDDDGNGFIDDVHGINLANENQNDNDPTGLPWTPLNTDHGTSVAGAAGAVTNNGIGVAGTAWNAEIMHINAGCHNVDVTICHGYAGVLYAAINGADIINTSWVAAVSDDATVNLIAQTLNLVTDMGALVVAGAGNDRANNDLVRFYPARHPRVLSVGATEATSRRIASFSHYGKLVSVFAPGEFIASTSSGNAYSAFSGTSFASPLVAGIAALVKTRFPNMSPDSLREQIRATSEPIDADNPSLAGQLGHGFVNALAAVQEPSSPGIRLRRWSWTDPNGDGQIGSGEQITVKLMVENRLADAHQLKVGLIPAEQYSFISIAPADVDVGNLAAGDSTEVSFEVTVDSNAPVNELVRFFTRIQEGSFEDTPDMLSFIVNRSLETVHRGLSALYTATNGDAWIENTNWDITAVPSERELTNWFGLYLSEGRLVEIYLPGNNLYGNLPGEIGNLSNLRRLLLPGNFLQGEIPAEVGNLAQLEQLRLAGNALAGEIPVELGKLSQLQGLWLHLNSLSGAIPIELGNLTKLRWLDLEENSLSGTIPPELGNLRGLEELFLGANSLSGEIPAQFGNLEELRLLSLYFNSLTGAIPADLGRLFQLETLRLELNSLTGPIPPAIGNLEQLRWLSLSENSLTGSIPSEIGNLSQLQQLNLDYNSLSGAIPPELGNLTELRQVFLEGNSLSGPIPSEIGNLSQLTTLALVGNSLTGPIPGELGNASQLETVYLGGNTLSGSIPAELGDLSNLHELFLEGNALSGTVPSELGNLSQLQSLSLSNNALTGMLPRSFMQLSNLQEFDYSGQELCAPEDAEFQAWLRSVPHSNGPTCGAVTLSGSIHDKAFTVGQAIADLVLPEASGGTGPYAYTLDPALPSGLAFDSATRTIGGVPMEEAALTAYTYSASDADGQTASLTFAVEVAAAVYLGYVILDFAFPRARAIQPVEFPEADGGVAPISYTLEPALPAGLTYDGSARTMSGTPIVVTADLIPYVYRATDVNGSSDSLNFNITVYSPVAAEQDLLPEVFAVHGNYPNPFEASTQLVVDLPWPARVSVEVLDITGRSVLVVAPAAFAAGRNQTIELNGASIPSGIYLYRMYADSREGTAMHVGRIVRVR